MADPLIEGRRVGAVVDRKIDVDGWDLDGRHDVIQVKLGEVFLILGGVGALRIQPGVKDGCLRGRAVVFVGAAQALCNSVGTNLLGDRTELLGNLRLAMIVVLGGQDRVEQDEDAGQEENGGRDRQKTDLERGLRLIGLLLAHAFSIRAGAPAESLGCRLTRGECSLHARGCGLRPHPRVLPRIRRQPAPYGACWPVRSRRNQPRGAHPYR